MNKKSLRLGLTLLLVLTLCFSAAIANMSAATVTEFGPVSELTTGTYVMVVPSITPTGMSQGAYYVAHEAAKNPGMTFAAFDEDTPESAARWKITKVSDTECTIQNEAKGAQGYLNLSASGLTYGAEKTMKFEMSGGLCKFFVVEGGATYYIRFTNGGDTKEPRFHSGTGTASHEFRLYGEQTYEAGENSGNADLPLPDGEPLLTIACVSDLHADYGLQSKDPYVRNSLIKALNKIREEDADVLLVGGDMTSDNAKMANNGGWKYKTFMNVMHQYEDLVDSTIKSGRSLWACGNHDFQAGEYEGYDSYAYYEEITKNACGEPLSIYRQKDDTSLSDQRYPEFVLGYHYNIEGFDFIVINSPYARSLGYSSGTLKWLQERLVSIGRSKTVFILTHYPLTDSRGISTPTYGISGSEYNAITGVLKNFPNVVYLYGHNHGGAESVYISDDTFERITSYTATGRVVNDRNIVPTSFITSFMGSVSYYKYSLNPDWLTAADPEIVQALMIYVYEDRLVFQMKNYGNVYGNKALASWTVMRNTMGNGSAENEDPNDITKELLVSTEENANVKYDSSKSIGNFNLGDALVTVESYSNSIAGPNLKDTMTLSVSKMIAGPAYMNLYNALKPVVKEFAAYSMTLKDNGAVASSGAVRVSLVAPDDFIPPFTTLTYAAYYLDANGVLHMTDTVLTEDGKLEFILPELTSFALSAKAVAHDDAPAARDPGGIGANTVGIVVAASIAAVALVAVVAVVVIKRRKPAAKTEK